MNETTATPRATEGRALERIGVQLYTVRTLLENEFVGGLEQVAALGYDEFEFAGYFDHSPSDIKALLDRLGVTAPAAHVGLGALRESLDDILAAAQTIGHQYIVCPWIAPEERTLDHYKQHAALFNRVGETCKAAGLQFAYHNHDFEFEEIDGQIPYDMLLAETDAGLVQMELDLFWIAKAGYDANAYFERYPGRFPLCHVKDMADAEEVAVGQGTIDFAGIFAQAEQAGFVHFFVEHDNADDPMQSLQTSYNHLKALRF